MTTEQWKVFEGIVRSCKNNKQSSINVGSKISRDAIIAVHEAFLKLAQEKAKQNLISTVLNGE